MAWRLKTALRRAQLKELENWFSMEKREVIAGIGPDKEA